jgi:hypothetical protein
MSTSPPLISDGTVDALTIRVASTNPMLTAMLRLIQASTVAQVVFDGITPDASGTGYVVKLGFVLTADQAPGHAAVHDTALPAAAPPVSTPPDIRVCPSGDDDEALAFQPPAASAPLPAAPADAPRFDLAHPAPENAAAVVAVLAKNPKLADVCRLLISPLLAAGYEIEPATAEPVLTRLANEFADVSPLVLSQVSVLLRRGRHRRMPDQGEIYAALGRITARAAAPSAPTPATKAA